MDFGISLPTKADSWRVVKRAEELGYSHAWFYDTAVLNAEIFVAMGAAAVTTSRIKLCAGVLTPSNRIAPVAAAGMASLNALAPGRIICGVGTGFTGRRTLGLGPVTLQVLEEYVVAIRSLLRGQTIDCRMEGQVHKTRLLTTEPEHGIMSIADEIPVHVSAFGPKGRKVTARVADGWLGIAGTPDSEASALAEMHAAWKDEGRDETALYTTLIGGGCVLRPGEAYDSGRALAQAGPIAAMGFHSIVEQETFGTDWYQGFPFPDALERYRAVYESYPAGERHLFNHRGHLMFLRPEETHINGDIIQAMTMTGPRDALVERIRSVKDAGYSQFKLSLPPGQEEDMLTSWMDVLERV